MRIGLIALKGVALHEWGVCQPGLRPMADVDLLVRADDVPGALRLIESMGYEPIYRSRREQTFAPRQRTILHPFAEHHANPVKIELHTRIAERLPLHPTEITELLLPPVGCVGLQPYTSVAHLMLHLLLHAAGNMRAHSLRFIQLHDMAGLAMRLDSGRWQQVLGGGESWWMFPPLAMVERYFPGTVPDWVMQRAVAASPRMLRLIAERHLLSDVSLSRLRMTYFAGIEWCRSIPESIEFAYARALPSAQTKAEVAACVEHHAWASASSWYRESLPRRALRWAVLRPARVATMHSVRAAYDTAPGES
jgi:hypothetical protein